MSRIDKLKRDLWNVLIGHCPSRRVRKFWLRRMLNSFSCDAFVGLSVKVLHPRGINIGPRSIINQSCIIDARGGDVVIGEDVDIGTDTHIWTLEHDPNDDDHGTKGGAITINHHVWIASRVTILPGVTISPGAVIAAGAVVTKDVEANAIMAGVPARKIGIRQNALQYKLNYSPRFR